MGSKTGGSKTGFSLIEMMVVLAIIAMVTAMTMPTVSSYFQLSLNSAARDLATTIKEAYNAAVITGKVYRMAYDMKTNEFWVESGPANTLIDTKSSLEKEERRKKFSLKLSADDAPVKNSFSLDKTITRKKMSLPRGVVYEDIVNQLSNEPLTSGVAYSHFFPSGISEQTIIHLKDKSKHQASLIITSLLGMTDLYDRYMKGSEVFAK